MGFYTLWGLRPMFRLASAITETLSLELHKQNYIITRFKDSKNIGKTSDTQKANPNSLNMSLTKDMK